MYIYVFCTYSVCTVQVPLINFVVWGNGKGSQIQYPYGVHTDVSDVITHLLFIINHTKKTRHPPPHGFIIYLLIISIDRGRVLPWTPVTPQKRDGDFPLAQALLVVEGYSSL